MSNSLKVAWINGMNIDRVHFEQQERYIERNINQKTIDVFENLYGIFDIEFQSEMFTQGKIGINRVSGISPDGTIFKAPDEDFLPEPLEIKAGIQSGAVIVLKIPISVDTVADLSIQNSLPDTKYIATHSMVSSKTFDDTSSSMLGDMEDNKLSSSYSQEKINVIMASLRLSLGVKGSKSSNEMEIPVCRIKSIDLNKNITLDEKFIPTSINIAKLPLIITFLEEMIHATAGHRDTLSETFAGINKASTTIDFETYIALNILKKWNILFSHIKNKSKLHPEYFYEKLLEFQADLLSLDINSNAYEYIRYDHLNIADSIVSIINRVKLLFSHIVAPKYIPAVVYSDGGIFVCSFDNVSILQESTIYMAVKGECSLELIQTTFKTQSKVGTNAKIRNLISAQLNGLNIEQLTIVPSILPHLNDYVYFKIDKTDSMWQDFKNENSIAIYITQRIPKPDIKMWAVGV